MPNGPQGCRSSGMQKALAPFEDRAILPTLAWDPAPWRNRAFLALSRRRTLIPITPHFVSWPPIIPALPRPHRISQEKTLSPLSSYPSRYRSSNPAQRLGWGGSRHHSLPASSQKKGILLFSTPIAKRKSQNI